MKTNLNNLKSTASLLFDAVDIQPLSNFPMFVQHPFTDSIFVPYHDEKSENNMGIGSIIDDKKVYKAWREQCFRNINQCKNAFDIFFLVRDPWKLTLLKYWKEDLSNEDFSKLLAEAWVLSENPNNDANCSISELINWFKHSKKECLMNEKDLKVYNELPEKFEVYRGVCIVGNPKGLSWTRNKNKAEWFAHRFDRNERKGYVQKALIKKENVLAYFNTRDEDEVVVDSIKIKNLIERV